MRIFYFLALVLLSTSCKSNNKVKIIKHKGVVVCNLDHGCYDFDITTTLVYKTRNDNKPLKTEFFLTQLCSKFEMDDSLLPFIVYRNENYYFYKYENSLSSDTVQVHFKYSIRVPEKARSIQLKDDKFYILTDQYYLPGLNRYKFDTDSIECDLSFRFNNDSMKIIHPYANNKQTNQINTNYIPYIIAGDYTHISKTKNNYKANFHFNKKIIIDSVKLNQVFETVCNSYKYYSKTFGEVNQDEINIYFLERNGGHLIDGGIILDENYINKQNPTLSIETISHEMAHLWWGDAVKINKSGFQESLTEYCSGLFLSEENGCIVIKDAYQKYLRLEFSNKYHDLKTIEPNSKVYKRIAYDRGPLILCQIENKIGKHKMVRILNNFFFKNKNKTVEIDDFINQFNEFPEIKDELNYYLNGHKWPDYSVNIVKNKEVSYSFKNNKYPTKVPVSITFSDKTIIIDTINISNSKGSINKNYNQAISTIIIDPNLTLLQDNIRNDFWSNEESYLSVPKINNVYDKKYYAFFDDLYEYIVKGINKPVNHFSDTTTVNKLLTNRYNKVSDITGEGYQPYIVDHGDGQKYFVLQIFFNSNGKKYFADLRGNIEEDKNSIKISKLNNFRFFNKR